MRPSKWIVSDIVRQEKRARLRQGDGFSVDVELALAAWNRFVALGFRLFTIDDAMYAKHALVTTGHMEARHC